MQIKLEQTLLSDFRCLSNQAVVVSYLSTSSWKPTLWATCHLT